MKVGDTYVIPPEQGIIHPGHTATVIAVRKNPQTLEDDGGPDLVTVKCECGKQWEWEDRYPDNVLEET